VVILAAGQGRRMGGPKIFREHGGRTFLERILDRCRESASPVTLAIDPAFRGGVEALLGRIGGSPPTLVEAAGSAPMLVSVQAALAAGAAECQTAWSGGFWLWPVDAPFLSAEGWRLACAAVRESPGFVWKLRAGGKTGHPIWFPGWSVPPIRSGAWPDGLLGFLATCPERIRFLPMEREIIADFNTLDELARVSPEL
jgi:CTP:molybdopterin cytidylyltransferase MocA